MINNAIGIPVLAVWHAILEVDPLPAPLRDVSAVDLALFRLCKGGIGLQKGGHDLIVLGIERNPRQAFANGLLARAYLATGEEDKADVALMVKALSAEAQLKSQHDIDLADN